jgi:hypothetical protein
VITLNKGELIAKLENSNFPLRDELLLGLKNGELSIATRPPGNIVSVKNFIRPIRSRISVLEYQFEQTLFIQKKIEHSKCLLEKWRGVEEEPCMLFRVDVDEQYFYTLYINPDADDVYGVFYDVTQEYLDKHMKRKSIYNKPLKQDK